MMTYKVGMFFADGDEKDVKTYNNYDSAFDDYIDRLKNEYHKLGYVPSKLQILYYTDGKYAGKEKLVWERGYD